MHVRGFECWPAEVVGDLVEEVHHGRRVRCYAGRPRTIGDLLERAATRFPSREAVVTPAERPTWAELRAAVRRLASGLAKRHGIGPGDRVAVLCANGLPYCVAVLACATLGAVAVVLNTKLRSRELEYMLVHSGARLLLGNVEWWDEVAPAASRLACEAFYLTPPGGGLEGQGALPAGTRPFAGLLAGAGVPPLPMVDADATAFIMYTSGTTGRPKGAEATHGGIVNSVISFERTMALRDDERTLVAVPLFHVTGLIAQLLTMTHVGGTAVVMPTFDADEALRLVDAERITHVIAAPTVYVMMMTRPGYRERGRTLRVLGYGGAPIAPDAVRALREWVPAARLHNAYGMTETCSPTTILPDADSLRRVSSVGRPIPTAEVRTVAPDRDQECAADEVGELWIRGPMVVPRYWADPEATAVSIRDGWLRSGDLGRIDGEGYVTLMDRIKDMINRGGEKIFCVEVEDVLCSHGDVLEAAVFGVPDPVYGEVVRACVVPRPGRVLDPEDVRAWVGARLARFKVPARVTVLEALPRNPNGKVVKSALRAGG